MAVTLVCIYGIDPAHVPRPKRNWWTTGRRTSGSALDLKGGSNLVYQIQMQDAFKLEADTVIQRLTR